jgi:hypothetical protein
MKKDEHNQSIKSVLLNLSIFQNKLIFLLRILKNDAILQTLRGLH